jgi:hypothetical protein
MYSFLGHVEDVRGDMQVRRNGLSEQATKICTEEVMLLRISKLLVFGSESEQRDDLSPRPNGAIAPCGIVEHFSYEFLRAAACASRPHPRLM